MLGAMRLIWGATKSKDYNYSLNKSVATKLGNIYKMRITYIKVWGATKSAIIITHYSIALNLIYFWHLFISSSCPSIEKER